MFGDSLLNIFLDRGEMCMKSKKLVSLFLAALMTVSVGIQPAFAAGDDAGRFSGAVPNAIRPRCDEGLRGCVYPSGGAGLAGPPNFTLP